MRCRVEGLSFGLKHLLAYLLVLLNSLNTELSPTSFRTLHQLNCFIFPRHTHWGVEYWLFGDNRCLSLLFCHLALQNSHEILVWIQGSLLSRVHVVVLGWRWRCPFLYWWSLIRANDVLRTCRRPFRYVWGLLFEAGRSLPHILLLMYSLICSATLRLFTLVHCLWILFFLFDLLPTHAIPAHLLFQQL